MWQPEAISKKMRPNIAHIGCRPLLPGRANRRDSRNRRSNYGEPAQVPRGPRAQGLEVWRVQADLTLLGRPSLLLGLEVLEALADRDGLALS